MNADERVQEIDAAIAMLNAERLSLLSSTTVVCSNKKCGASSCVCDLVLLRYMYYVEPYSCTGGDYWTCSYVGFYCLICGESTRYSVEKDSRLTTRSGHFGGTATVVDRDSSLTLVNRWDAALKSKMTLMFQAAGWKVVDNATV